MQPHKIFYFVVVAARLVLPFPACFVRMQTRIQIPGGVRGRAKVRFFIITSARDKKGEFITKAITNDDGMVQFSNLHLGKYVVKEETKRSRRTSEIRSEKGKIVSLWKSGKRKIKFRLLSHFSVLQPPIAY